jgi:hypothetical protein
MSTPAGWYLQPDGGERYWDGQVWTDQFFPSGAARVQSFLSLSRKRINDTLEAGGPAWLYKSSYVPVDAQIEQVSDPIGLQLGALNEAGWSGWEVIGVVPRTYAGSQTYIARSSMTMRNWGGEKTNQRTSLSGNVIGVYVLLRMRITPECLALRGAEIDEVIRLNCEPTQQMPPSDGGLTKKQERQLIKDQAQQAALERLRLGQS